MHLCVFNSFYFLRNLPFFSNYNVLFIFLSSSSTFSFSSSITPAFISLFVGLYSPFTFFHVYHFFMFYAFLSSAFYSFSSLTFAPLFFFSRHSSFFFSIIRFLYLSFQVTDTLHPSLGLPLSSFPSTFLLLHLDFYFCHLLPHPFYLLSKVHDSSSFSFSPSILHLSLPSILTYFLASIIPFINLSLQWLCFPFIFSLSLSSPAILSLAVPVVSYWRFSCCSVFL